MMRKKSPKPKVKVVKAKGAKASDKNGQASRSSKATTVAPKVKRATSKVKPMWKKTQAPPRVKKPVEVKPKQMAPEVSYSDKPVEAKPIQQAPHIEQWRCVWCGNLEDIDVHQCGRCGQFR
jgi:formylmethanofuran dehydrogenase subunit E